MAAALRDRTSTIPETMWALELQGSGPEALVVVERPTPRPGPGQALCRVEAASVCASDGKLVRLGGRHRNLHGWDPAARPIVPGHEGSLVVAAVGERLKNHLRPGERLVVAPNLPGPPRFDLDGYRRPLDEISRVTVGFTVPGLLAQYVLLREDVIEAPGHVIPVAAASDLLPHYGAALAEPLSTVVAAHASMIHILRSATDGERVYRSGILPGGVTVLIGAGPMGLLNAAHSFLRRPRRVIVSEPAPARRAAAERLRALAEEASTELEIVEPERLADRVRAASDGRGADDVIVTAGSSQVEEEALSLAGAGGCVSFFASNPPDDSVVRLNAGDVHYRSIAISGTSGSDPADLRRAIEVQERGALNLGPFVSAVGGIAAAPSAIRAVMEGRFEAKVVIYPHASAPEIVPVEDWGPDAEASFLREGS